MGRNVIVIFRSLWAPRWITHAVLGLAISGCATWQPPADTSCDEQQDEQQDEILRLQRVLVDKERVLADKERVLADKERVLADKESEINRLRAQQQGQVKELEKTTSQAARAEVKLRRFATETEVASRLAEVEVAMEGLKSKGREFPLQLTAQRLLSAASIAFKQSELSVAADLAAQAEQLINMLSENGSMPDTQSAPEVPFKIAIPLKTKADTRLRNKPQLDAAVLIVLQQTTLVVAQAYQGQWLHVQTEDGVSGWVLGELLEPR